jgi:hypothetical protein
MSKGSRPRPYSVSQDQFGTNYDAIFEKKDRRVVEDAQLEDEEFRRIKNTQIQEKDNINNTSN